MWRCCASGWCKRANKPREVINLITGIDWDGYVAPNAGGPSEIVRIDCRDEFELADDLSMFGPTSKGQKSITKSWEEPMSSGLVHTVEGRRSWCANTADFRGNC
jgi:hypothetical protein